MKRVVSLYLNAEIELSDERAQHILERHPELGPDPWAWIEPTICDPDLIRCSARMPEALQFSRWCDSLLGGKLLVVVVIAPQPPGRNWIITSYATTKPSGGEVLWTRS